MLVRMHTLHIITCQRAACLMLCSQSVKDLFLGASLSESECKGTDFLNTGKIFRELFLKNLSSEAKTVELDGEKQGKLGVQRSISGDKSAGDDSLREAFFPHDPSPSERILHPSLPLLYI